MKRSLTFFLILVLCSLCALGATNILRSDRISMHYPSTLSEEAAARLLANREAALAYAEESLGCQVTDRITYIITASGGGGRGSATHVEYGLTDRILRQFEDDQALSPTFLGCHEEIHTVMFTCWGRGAFMLSEGLAMYLDLGYRGGIDNTLISRGLLELDLLPSVEDVPRLYLTFNKFNMGNTLSIYYGGGSLVEYLIVTYGLEAFMELHKHSRRPDDFAGASPRILGLSLSDLECDWHAYIRTETEGRERAAQLLPDTLTWHPELRAQWKSLGELSREWPDVLGRSAVYEDVEHARSDAVEELQAATSDQAADSAYQRYQCTTAQMALVLKTWLEAATAYRDFLQSRDELTIPEQAQLLRKALDNYTIVGDEALIRTVESEFIELQSRRQ